MLIKDTITKKISLITLGGLIILSCYFIISSYVIHLQAKTNASLQHLAAIVKNVAVQIDGNDYQQLIAEHQTKDQINANDQHPAYLNIHQTLKQAAQLNNLNTPIYTLTLDQSKKAF